MYIPDKVRLGAYEFKIEQVEPLDTTDEWGSFNLLHQKIRLRKDLPESLKAQIFMHELLEMVCKRLDFEIDHHKLTLIGEELFSVIRNNNLDFREAKMGEDKPVRFSLRSAGEEMKEP